MKLSIYTFVRNGIYFDYHFKEMLKHHLPLADEIIVNEGYSSDGTYEAIANIDSKIKVFRSDWGKIENLDWLVRIKDSARLKCTGDWCILLDCDEFIPEWEFERLREYLNETKDYAIPLHIINFYGNYKVYHTHPEKVPWPSFGMKIHRNLKEIEILHDGSHVHLKNSKLKLDINAAEFQCHHFGFVRNAGRLREKWRNIHKNFYNSQRGLLPLPSFLYDLFPHNWMDPQFLNDLVIYEGPYIQAVRENPDEFVRDNFVLYDYLKNKTQRSHKLED